MYWYTVASFLLGAGAGALSMYLLRHRFGDTHTLQRRLAELETEAEEYHAQVDEHFERTSDLFQEVTEKYRQLHDHLAQGATGLARGAKRLPSIELPDRVLRREPEAGTGDGEAGNTPAGGDERADAAAASDMSGAETDGPEVVEVEADATRR